MKPYRPGTPLHKIIEDGWSRGFNPIQTMSEAGAMGFRVDVESVTKFFSMYEESMNLNARLSRIAYEINKN